MGAPYLGRLSTLNTVAGCAFSVLSVLINLTDVTSDVVVAVQFHRDGDATWFWLVVSSLIIAHLVYVVVGLVVLPSTSGLWGLPWGLRVVVLLLIAQFAPLLQLIDELYSVRQQAIRDGMRHLRPAEATSDYDDNHEPAAAGTPNDTRSRLQGAMAEELDDIAVSTLIWERMQDIIVRAHFDRFGLFHVESVVEAGPQAIIQLLAITFLGRASPAQLVSLCCSLFSITGKAFVISRAYDVRVMAFKFALAAHDVFSTFYLFSTLVETAKDTNFFGLEVSWLGYIWLWKIVVYACVGTLTAGLAMAGQLVREAYDKHRGWDTALISLLVTLGCGPTLLLLEAGKLTR